MSKRLDLLNGLPEDNQNLSDGSYVYNLEKFSNEVNHILHYLLNNSIVSRGNEIDISTNWNDLDLNSSFVVTNWNGNNAPKLSGDEGLAFDIESNNNNLQVAISPKKMAIRTNDGDWSYIQSSTDPNALTNTINQSITSALGDLNVSSATNELNSLADYDFNSISSAASAASQQANLNATSLNDKENIASESSDVSSLDSKKADKDSVSNQINNAAPNSNDILQVVQNNSQYKQAVSEASTADSLANDAKSKLNGINFHNFVTDSQSFDFARKEQVNGLTPLGSNADSIATEYSKAASNDTLSTLKANTFYSLSASASATCNALSNEIGNSLYLCGNNISYNQKINLRNNSMYVFMSIPIKQISWEGYPLDLYNTETHTDISKSDLICYSLTGALVYLHPQLVDIGALILSFSPKDTEETNYTELRIPATWNRRRGRIEFKSRYNS